MAPVNTAEQLLASFAIYDQNAHLLKTPGILNGQQFKPRVAMSGHGSFALT